MVTNVITEVLVEKLLFTKTQESLTSVVKLGQSYLCLMQIVNISGLSDDVLNEITSNGVQLET